MKKRIVQILCAACTLAFIAFKSFDRFGLKTVILFFFLFFLLKLGNEKFEPECFS